MTEKKRSDLLIYGREKGKGKKFMPYDGRGGFTGNLIYAARFPPDGAEMVQEIVDRLNRDNPDYEFEMRRGNGTFHLEPQPEPKYTMFDPHAPDPNKGRHITGGEVEYLRRAEVVPNGDIGILARIKGSGSEYTTFDGFGLGGKVLRWPNDYIEVVRDVMFSLSKNNPDYEFKAVFLPDTVFIRYPYPSIYNNPLNEPRLHRIRFRKKTESSCDLPATEWPTEPKPPVQGVVRGVPKVTESARPMDYSVQMFGSEIITPPIEGKRTQSAKCRAIDGAISSKTGGAATVVRSTMKGKTYYGVAEVCSPEIGSRQRILLTGNVLDDPKGGVSTFLLQSDTGSRFLDAPQSYLKMIDEPRTDADEEYRRKVSVRKSGDGRSWKSRKYTIDGREVGADEMVGIVSKRTGKTPWEVETTRDIRAMRVFDEYDAGGVKVTRSYNRRRGRR